MPGTWLGAIVVGFLAGLLARMLSSDPRNPTGCFFTIVLGMAGAALATWVGRIFKIYSPDDYAGFLPAVIGAVGVLILWRVIQGKRI